jgi:class 3 adenylate cyclase
MEPRIQYAKTKDGVSIAFWTMGEGAPFVVMPGMYSHIQLEWQNRDVRRWYEGLAEKRRLVRYDGRGTGLSDREVTDYSLDARLLDLEAVVDHLELESFALWGYHDSGPVAIAYAARCPQRVSHLVLWCTWAKTADPPWVRARNELLRKDWEMYTETSARGVLGWSADEEARWLAATIRESVTPDAVLASSEAADEFDVTDLLGQVTRPTLVLHRRQLRWPEVDVARGLASRIPDARLALLEGTSWVPFWGDTESVLRAVNEFLGEGEEAAARAAPSGLVTILFTDVEGSTALTQRLGDAKARDLLRQHERMVRNALKSHGGSELKTMGDGFMASFSSATRALESAIAMQRAFAAHNESAPEPILVRVGLNAGEPVAEEKDLFGTAVNLAARICGHAEAGQILASDVVRQLVAGKDFLFADRGEAALKGFDEPVRLFEVKWE